MSKTIWLRHETKAFEQRCILTPEACKTLSILGNEVIIESSPTRCFKDEEYTALGLKIVRQNSWITDAPKGAIILGLKELDSDENFPLIHRHIHFAHVYKNQIGSRQMLNRFVQGDGKLYDLEYLTDETNNRISAFGVWAGFIGAALGVKQWALAQNNKNLNEFAPLKSYTNSQLLANSVQELLDLTKSKPRALVIGAKGRCGKGAMNLLRMVGIEAIGWGSNDTKDKGPIAEILDFDILINCALSKKPRPPFLTKELLQQERNLSVISDIACDPTGPCNPLPIYQECSTMDLPVVQLNFKKPLYLTSIDHLPSLLPRESSTDFCEQLLPHLMDFLDNKIENTPWENSLGWFYKKTMELGLEEKISISPDTNKLM